MFTLSCFSLTCALQIGAHDYGRVSLMDISDDLKKSPLAELSEGSFVKCFVLDVNHKEKRCVQEEFVEQL